MDQTTQINHDVKEGEEYVCNNGSVYYINEVRPDGSVEATRVEGDDGVGDEVEWNHNGLVTALVHGDVKRVADGKSHELVGNF